MKKPDGQCESTIQIKVIQDGFSLFNKCTTILILSISYVFLGQLSSDLVTLAWRLLASSSRHFCRRHSSGFHF